MAVTPERSVLSIIPTGSLLQAELLVPTHAAGFLRQGQEVRLRYDAFPYQKFGLYRAAISSISRTVSHPEDQVGPARLSVPAYRVIAGLETQYVTAYGSELPLQPGLTLRADIVRDRRRILEWIFDPLIAAVKGI
jgi:membrane fusion protein